MISRRLAHYELTAHLGSGGMGDVYQATDTRLGRNVALKFLPTAFAGDRERAERFDREARALAALNHPNIAAIHGLEDADGQSFLVMELVPGQTLAQLINHRPLPLDEALGIARQVVEALEAAHERGIVHRDLKPANVKVTPDGQVKVLDFGLAKFASPEAEESAEMGGAHPSNSPTFSGVATQAGVILGTAAYMAPEQARGRAVDRRADIFAFGCVLYEMLTGRPAFTGDNVPDILSQVLQREPDWTRLPGVTPPALQRLLRLCLEKDPKKRRQAAGDVRLDLESALAEPEALTAPGGRERGSRVIYLASLASALVLMAALAIPAVIHLREAPPPEMRLHIVTPPTAAPLHFALSPDGQHIVFVASEPSSDVHRLYLRALDETDARPLSDTEGALHPFWSPDSRSVGFFASEHLRRIDISGGPAQTLAFAQAPQGGAWNGDGTILFAPNTVSPLLRVPASGGETAAATKLDSPRQLGHRSPSFLPDGRQFLFFAQGDPGASGIFLGSLDALAATRLTAAESAGLYLAPDRLIFAQQGALVARRLDRSRGELTGDPVTLAPSVGGFSTSATGILAYRASGGTPEVIASWYDRAGNVLAQDVEWWNGPDLSHDQRHLAFDRTVHGNRDVWILDLVRGGLTRFTFDAAVDGFPVWSPDGSQIVFESTRKGTFDLWIKPASGAVAEELLLDGPDHEWPLSWSSDGRFLLYQKSDLKEAWDLWALPMTDGNRRPLVVANTPFQERMGQFSPDGRWIVFETNESGRPEIVAQAFPVAAGKWQVSTGGGTAPRWCADGREIYFIAPDGKLMVVPVTTTGSKLEAGAPEALFSTQLIAQPFRPQYAVARDGRFLINSQTAAVEAAPITLILNWKP